MSRPSPFRPSDSDDALPAVDEPRQDVDTDGTQRTPVTARSPDNSIVPERQLMAVMEALGRLPDDCRQLIAWRHMENRSFDDMARQLAVTPDEIRGRWWRAIKQLQELLGDSL